MNNNYSSNIIYLFISELENIIFLKKNKVFKLIIYFIKAKKNWKRPNKCNIIIYDAAGIEGIKSILKYPIYEIIHTRNESLNIPVLIKSFLYKGSFLNAYIYCYIKDVNPRIIITNIDNNLYFYTLSLKFPYIKTIFIQNGMRGFYLDIFETLENNSFFNNDLQVDFMFTFGNQIGNEYKKYINGKNISIGSIKNNLVPKTIVEKNVNKISFISQYRKQENYFINGKQYSHDLYFKKSDKYIINFLVNYSKNKSKELEIITYNTKNTPIELKEEINYFNNLACCELTYSIREDLFSSYHKVDSSEVVVGIDSTLTYESAARGNKTAFFSIRSFFTELKGCEYGWPALIPNHGPYWSNTPNERIFENILDHLFEIDEIEWEKELKKNEFENIMIYDPDNKLICNYLSEILSFS